jgi:hypothetical protein
MTTGPVTRRSLAGGLAGLGLGTVLPDARAQQVAQPLPICAVGIEGTGAPPGSVTTFGMAFAPGDLPAGSLPVLRHAGGTLPTQCNILVAHQDGSARHAFLAVEIPALANGRVIEASLFASGGAPAAALPPNAYAGRSAVLRIAPPDGGEPFVLDLVASIPAGRWVHGALATQARVEAPVPAAAAGGVGSLRVFADLMLLKDGTLWIDLALRNDVGFRPNSGTARYSVLLEQDGVAVFRHADVVHPLFRNLMRVSLAGTLPGGRVASERPLVRHDVPYLAQRARVVPNVDRQLGLWSQMLPRMRAVLNAPDWDIPFAGRGLATSWGAGGVPDFIGPITGMQVAWLIDGGREWRRICIGQSEAQASAPMHVWDPDGGVTRRGAWVNGIDRPGLWLDGRDARFRPLTDNAGATHRWNIGSLSHMPSGHYVPYLLTARRAILDAQLAQSAYTLMAFGRRGGGWDPRTGEGMNVSRGEQWRTMGWSLRELLNAAYVAPPSEEPHPFYFHAACVGNLNYLNGRIPSYDAASGELRGHFRDAYGLGTPRDNYSYHTEYMVSSFIKAVWFGIPGAKRFLEWQLNWLTGRFLNEPDFHPSNLIRLAISFPYFRVRTWAELGAANRVFGPLPVSNWNATGEAGFDCLPHIAMNLASLMDIFPDDPRVARAWRWLSRPNVPEIEAMRPIAFNGGSNKRSVVPAGQTRASVPPQVLAGQVFRLRRDAPRGSPVGVLRVAGGQGPSFGLAGPAAAFLAVDDAGVLVVSGEIPGPGRLVAQVSAANQHGRGRDTPITVEIA